MFRPIIHPIHMQGESEKRDTMERGVPWILGLAPGILDQTCNFGLISLIKAKSPIRELPPIKRGSVLILHFWIQP